MLCGWRGKDKEDWRGAWWGEYGRFSVAGRFGLAGREGQGGLAECLASMGDLVWRVGEDREN